MTANCPRCSGTSFTWTSTTMNGVPVLIVYCSNCGYAIGAVNNKK
jgi:Zn ribbon nucleic-acid-binding protein